MTADDAAALAQRATARPWGIHDYEDEVYVSTPTGHGYVAQMGGGVDASREHEQADAALIVYAVNHIEQAEAERDEALAILSALVGQLEHGTAKGYYIKRMQEARAFLAAHPVAK